MISFPGFSETYAQMSDSELLNLASEASSLEKHAQIALASELSRRNLSESDVIQHGQQVASCSPQDFWGRDQYLAESINGCGTGLYGKRDFAADGSFMTTQWFAAFFVPLFPLASMRVKTVQRGLFASRYFVVEKTRPNAKRVMCVYAYVMLFVLTMRYADVTARPFAVLLSGSLLLLPWGLRRLACFREQRGPDREPNGRQALR